MIRDNKTYGDLFSAKETANLARISLWDLAKQRLDDFKDERIFQHVVVGGKYYYKADDIYEWCKKHNLG